MHTLFTAYLTCKERYQLSGLYPRYKIGSTSVYLKGSSESQKVNRKIIGYFYAQESLNILKLIFYSFLLSG